MELQFLDLLRDIFLYTGILSLAVYLYFSNCYNYWRKRNFPFLPPKFPLGNNGSLLCKFPGSSLESFDHYRKIKRKGYKYAGVFSIVRPILVVIDPEMVKNILVKDFEYFTDRGFYKTESDPLSISMFTMDSIEWKKTRMKMSPTFTSGKIKMMMPLVVSKSELMVNEIGDLAGKNTDIDIKRIATKFTINTFASCALGTEPEVYGSSDMFAKMARKHFDSEAFMNLIRFSLLGRFPGISSKLGLNMVKKEVSDFFRTVLKESIRYREENKFTRPDLLQILMNLRNGTENTSGPLTDDQLTAELLNFFLASVDTSPNSISFTLFELARNPDMQKRLRDEISDMLRQHNEPNAECLSGMKYMRQVINEALRLYPPLPTLERKCVKNYRIIGTDLIIEKGTDITIPIFGIHRDAEYHPEPEKFDPERFNDENKRNITSQMYLPFGIGPRSCVGLRFGYMLVQIALIHILQKYKLSVSTSTRLPLEMDKRALMLTLKSPILLKAEIIQD